MPSTILACPKCRAAAADEQPKPGGEWRCPSCQTTFRVLPQGLIPVGALNSRPTAAPSRAVTARSGPLPNGATTAAKPSPPTTLAVAAGTAVAAQPLPAHGLRAEADAVDPEPVIARRPNYQLRGALAALGVAALGGIGYLLVLVCFTSDKKPADPDVPEI